MLKHNHFWNKALSSLVYSTFKATNMHPNLNICQFHLIFVKNNWPCYIANWEAFNVGWFLKWKIDTQRLPTHVYTHISTNFQKFKELILVYSHGFQILWKSQNFDWKIVHSFMKFIGSLILFFSKELKLIVLWF